MKLSPWARVALPLSVAVSAAIVLGVAGAARAMHAASPVKPRPPVGTAPAAPTAGAATAANDSGAIVSGFDSISYGGNDDGTYPCTSQQDAVPPGCTPTTVSLPFPIDFFGTTYNAVYLNNNGNLTFGTSLGTYTPYPLSETGPPMIAPFFADVDTRTGNTVAFGSGTVNGRPAWGVTWPGVGCYFETTSVLNTFQVILVDRSDIGAGDFDVEFNYGSIQWDSGQASGGNSSCVGGTAARAGYASGSGATGSYFELPGSGENNALLDSNPDTGLVNGSHGSNQRGRYIYAFRSGLPLTTSGAPASGVGQGNGDTAVHDPTCSHGHPVNCASGEFWHAVADVGVPGRGPGLALARTYNSMSAGQDGSFGHGWASILDMRIVSNSDGTATITAEDGSQVTAAPTGGGAFVLPTWASSTLTHNSDGTWTFVRHRTQTFTFSADGLLTRIADPNGYATTLARDAAGEATSMTDASGRSLSFVYAAGHATAVTDPAGRTTHYAYDAGGDLTSVTDAAGGVTSYTYDAAHRLLTMTDPRGGVSTNVYDGSGRVTRQTDPLGRVTTYAYTGTNFSASGGTTTITDPNGNVERQVYTSGELVQLTRGLGAPVEATWKYDYDQNTLGRTSVTDPNGATTTIVYDADGNATSVTDAAGRTTTYQYDALDRPTTVSYPGGLETTRTYDTHGNLTSVVRGAGTSLASTVTLDYADATHPGDVTSITDATGGVTTFVYDARGNITKVVDPVGNATTYTYDVLGQTTSITRPAGGTTSYSYDALERPTKTTDPLGGVSTQAYDADGNLVGETDATGNTTTYAFDADNEPTSATRADGTAVRYAYDANGNQLSQQDGAGHTTTYAYDALDRMVSTTDPLGRTTTYAYDLVGHRTGLTDAAGRTTTFDYDPVGQVTDVAYSAAKTPNVGMTYAGTGARAPMTDGTGTTSYTYDAVGRLSSQTNGAGQTVSYGYDASDRLTRITYPNGKSVTRTYDAAGRLTGVTDWLSHTTSFTSDADGNTAAIAYANGVSATSTFDRDDRLTAIATKAPGGTTLASFGYTRNANGLLTGATASGVGQSETYTYTKLNQIGSVNGSGYGYDAADNLTTLANGATLAYDAGDEAVHYTPATGSPVDLTYDAVGNRVSGLGGVTYTYDQANRLTVSAGGGGAATAGMLAAGQFHSLATTSSGAVWTWGYNADGELGDGTTTNRTTPVQVSGVSGATAVAAGDLHSLALQGGGTVESWGSNAFGQLGDGTTTTRTAPVQVSGLTNATAVAAGNYHSIALRSDGSVVAWGYNGAGELGDGTLTNRSTPVAVRGLTDVIAVAGGGLPGWAGHSVALKSDGTVWTWGYNKHGELGLGTTSSTTTPQKVPGLSAVSAIAASGDNTYALKADGTVWAWGDDGYGQLGPSVRGTQSATPVQVSISGVTQIAAGGTHVLALKSDGSAWAWGNNNTGQLGDGGACGKTCATPVKVAGLTNVAVLAGGYVHSLSALADGTVRAWGRNAEGELGDGTTTVRATPVVTSGLSDVKASNANGSYAYDGDGLRASRTIGSATQHFAWDMTAPVPLLLTDGSTSYIYDDSGLPVEQVDAAGNVLYYQHDQLGSTRLLTTSTGGVAGTFTYDAYGNLVSKTGTIDTPLRWAGQYQDSTTGFYYFRARYYDPQTGQFVTRDPAGALTQQPYQYVGGDVLNEWDANGLFCCKSITHAISSGWNTVKGAGSDAAHWVYDHAGDISAVAGALALIPEPLQPVFAAVAVGTGALAAYQDVKKGEYISAALDFAGAAFGTAGLAREIKVRQLERLLGGVAREFHISGGLVYVATASGGYYRYVYRISWIDYERLLAAYAATGHRRDLIAFLLAGASAALSHSGEDGGADVAPPC